MIKRPESYDPRPHNRQQDLALRRREFDADTAQINRRTQELNERQRRDYERRVAAQAKPKPAAKPQGMLASAIGGLRRRLGV